MPRLLKTFMIATDGGMIAYWTLTTLAALGAIALPREWLFSDYHDPTVVSWNWSFLPLDLALSATGLAAVWLATRGDPSWRILAAVSLTLTVCAGLMAIAFWAIRCDFDPAWWAANLFLLLWPIPFLVSLACEAQGTVPNAARPGLG